MIKNSLLILNLIIQIKKTKLVIKPITTTKTKPVSRPWQGAVLGIIYTLHIIITIIMISGALWIVSQLPTGNTGDIISIKAALASTLILGSISLFSIFKFILQIFVTRGIFKGQKWTVVASIVFTALSLSGLIRNFNLITLIIDGALMYLSIACLLHPFYGGKK